MQNLGILRDKIINIVLYQKYMEEMIENIIPQEMNKIKLIILLLLKGMIIMIKIMIFPPMKLIY